MKTKIASMTCAEAILKCSNKNLGLSLDCCGGPLQIRWAQSWAGAAAPGPQMFVGITHSSC